MYQAFYCKVLQGSYSIKYVLPAMVTRNGIIMHWMMYIMAAGRWQPLQNCLTIRWGRLRRLGKTCWRTADWIRWPW